MGNGERVKLRVVDLNLNFGGIQALTDVNLEVREGEILGVIGPNGAGKTCLFNCIQRFYHPQSGECYFEDQLITGLPTYMIARLGISRVFQNIELFTAMSVLDNLLAARIKYVRSSFWSQALYFGRAHKEEIRQRERVEEIIDFLEMAAIRKRVVGALPYGLRKRVELGRALAMEPKLLLLDEPMAGMNVEEKEDMARFILDLEEEQGLSIILVEHDMEVIMDIADRVVVLDFGQLVAQGSPEEVASNPRVIDAYLGESSFI